MRIAVLSDIHGNLEALEEVLDMCKGFGVERYMIGGDTVGYGADPVACIERVRALPLMGIVLGNHDAVAIEECDCIGFQPLAAHTIEWTRKQLRPCDREWLQSLRLSIQIGRISLVHASLDSPGRWPYVFDRHNAGASFSYQFSQVCFHGHTHVPLAFERFGAIHGGTYSQIHVQPGHKYLVNVGSVGQPRDKDPRAAFVVYDQDEGHIQLHRVEYDITTTQRKILAAGLPEKNATRLETGI